MGKEMGYRELLKKYILHLQLTAGDNFIDAVNPESVLNSRDLGELNALAAELNRGAYNPAERTRAENYNSRLRVLMNQHALSPAQLAQLVGIEVDLVKRWRTSPDSDRYVPVTEIDFLQIQRAVERWLETSAH